MNCSEDVVRIKKFVEKDCAYQFLVRLNPEFNWVRIQILGKEETSLFNKVIFILIVEDSK